MVFDVTYNFSRLYGSTMERLMKKGELVAFLFLIALSASTLVGAFYIYYSPKEAQPSGPDPELVLLQEIRKSVEELGREFDSLEQKIDSVENRAKTAEDLAHRVSVNAARAKTKEEMRVVFTPLTVHHLNVARKKIPSPAQKKAKK